VPGRVVAVGIGLVVLTDASEFLCSLLLFRPFFHPQEVTGFLRAVS
jgi:hypothetical protein